MLLIDKKEYVNLFHKVLTMNVSEEIVVVVDSEQPYSSEPLIIVKEGELYNFYINPQQVWKDWCIPSSPNGFINPLTWFGRKRVKNAKCFCLCGTIGKNDSNHFILGSGSFDVKIRQSGNLYFFANDHKDYYKNNSGKINVKITRIS